MIKFNFPSFKWNGSDVTKEEEVSKVIDIPTLSLESIRPSYKEHMEKLTKEWIASKVRDEVVESMYLAAYGVPNSLLEAVTEACEPDHSAYCELSKWFHNTKYGYYSDTDDPKEFSVTIAGSKYNASELEEANKAYEAKLKGLMEEHNIPESAIYIESCRYPTRETVAMILIEREIESAVQRIQEEAIHTKEA